MIIQPYLVIKKNGSVEVRKTEPRLDGNEISLRLAIEVPNEFFQRPRLEATLKVPKESIPKVKITTEITDNVEKIIKETTGLNMVVSVIEQAIEKPNDSAGSKTNNKR